MERGRFLQRDLSLGIVASDIRLLVAIKNLVKNGRSAATLATAITVPVIQTEILERQKAQKLAAASQWQMPQTAMAGYWQPQSLFKIALPAVF